MKATAAVDFTVPVSIATVAAEDTLHFVNLQRIRFEVRGQLCPVVSAEALPTVLQHDSRTAGCRRV